MIPDDELHPEFPLMPGYSSPIHHETWVKSVKISRSGSTSIAYGLPFCFSTYHEVFLEMIRTASGSINRTSSRTSAHMIRRFFRRSSGTTPEMRRFRRPVTRPELRILWCVSHVFLMFFTSVAVVVFARVLHINDRFCRSGSSVISALKNYPSLTEIPPLTASLVSDITNTVFLEKGLLINSPIMNYSLTPFRMDHM